MDFLARTLLARSTGRWHYLDSFTLTRIPDSLTAIVPRRWKDFVVPIPELEVDNHNNDVKRRKVDEDTPSSGYRLTIDTCEYCDEEHFSNTFDDLPLNKVRLYTSILFYCNRFGDRMHSHDYQREAEVINMIGTALGKRCDPYMLMHRLFGVWSRDGSKWRLIDKVHLEHVDYSLYQTVNGFEEEAYRLAKVGPCPSIEDIGKIF
eukprot:TRINITY_DN34704_c0_g1_i1.p1 TRINITY_DN34704_c0_g1~~TRINITY_DN34704_c0_g1_i1.p1  ORF type:complete len:205 (+),score=15.90 TRINITY_DN34704_c0_g1_i1:460-1074(+)